MARLVEIYVEGLGPLLKDQRALPKEATAELRTASVVIAERHMVPSWRNAAMRAGGWGPKLAASIRAKKDRTPALQVGYQKKVYSGKASTNMVRYPSYRGTKEETRDPWPGLKWAPFGKGTGWMATRRPYEQAAITEWGQAVDKIVRKWDTNT
jgi:hypothetical protein